MAQCPECEAIIDVDPDEIEEGDIVTCPDCSVDLEIINTNPLEFNMVEDIDGRDDDDYDDDDDDEEDDDDDDDDDLDDDYEDEEDEDALSDEDDDAYEDEES